MAAKNRNKILESHSQAKDEFEYATNWTRVFIQLYQNLKWLNAYADINQQALQKLAYELTTTYFD